MSGRVWQRGMAAAVVSVAVVGFSRGVPAADEGMWTFDNPPLEQLKERVQLQPTTGMAGSSCACRRSVQRRRLGLLRQPRTAWC